MLYGIVISQSCKFYFIELRNKNDMLGKKRLIIFCAFVCFCLQACASAGGEVDTAVSPEPTIQLSAQATSSTWIEANRDPNVPPLPFPDNPDPNQCGIPTQWGGDGNAWLNGIYEGELIQPTLFLYDSHSRLSITAEAPHGTPVTVILYQQNPVLDYYLVKIEGAPKPNEGWIPGPLLSFNPVTALEDLPNN